MNATPRFGLVVLATEPTAEILLRGEVDAECFPELRAAVAQLLASPHVKRIELDVALTTFCDQADLSALFRTRLAAHECGAALCLVRVPAYLLRVLDAAGLTTMLILRRDE